MLSIIVAYDDTQGIGRNNQLLWHIKSDLNYFKEVTTNKTIVIGSKTFKSIGRVLPNRKNIILTRDKSMAVSGATMCNSVDEIIKKYEHSPMEVFICGGADIYEQFLPYVNRIYITEVSGDYKADTFFPAWDDGLFDLKVTIELETGVIAKQYERKRGE